MRTSKEAVLDRAIIRFVHDFNVFKCSSTNLITRMVRILVGDPVLTKTQNSTVMLTKRFDKGAEGLSSDKRRVM